MSEHNKKDYIENARKASNSITPKFASFSIYLLAGLFVAGLLWAANSRVEIITKASGKIIPTKKLQVVQNLEGGIIKKILVKEGDIVKEGQIIAKLDDTQFSSEHKKESSKYHVLTAEISRLRAEANGQDSIDFPQLLKEKHQALVQSETKVFQKNRSVLQSEMEVLQKSYDLLRQELNIIEPLAKEGVMSRLDVIRLKRELNTLKGEVLKRKNEFQRRSRQQLHQLRARRQILQEDLTRTKDKMQRTVIAAPQDGVINKVYVSTVGQVVEPGKKIMDIVPSHHALTIIAKVEPADIAQIKKDQKAIIKVSAYSYSKHGGLDAKVTNISADTLIDQEGKSFYEVQLQADKNYFGTDANLKKITPGMTVNINFVSGHRTILEYLMRPFLRAKEGALRER